MTKLIEVDVALATDEIFEAALVELGPLDRARLLILLALTADMEKVIDSLPGVDLEPVFEAVEQLKAFRSRYGD